MFDSKSPIVKYVGYFIIGFFLLIIIISFGMPDFMSRLGLDQSTVGTVNGEKIHRLAFLRYKDQRFRNVKDNKMDDYILNNMIQELLLLQKAKGEGFSVSDERIHKSIKEMAAFKDETGTYSPQRFELVLNQNHLSFTEFVSLIKDDMTRREFDASIRMGIAVTEEDAMAKYTADNSKFQVRYGYLATRDFKKRNKNSIIVTNEEVEAELRKNLKEIKDPKTDRKRIKTKLTRKKLADLENRLIAQLNAVSAKKGSFGAAAGLLKGQLSMSAQFKAGDQVKDSGKKGKSLSLLANSAIFRKHLMSLKPGQVSPAIKTATGIYIFTPVVQTIAKEKPKEEEMEKTRTNISFNHYRTISMNILKQLSMESKIIKNLKTN